ncbi:SRPBCC family protein [Alicycliphilus denitrificans]|uniref:Carbon monoxide dehydrogenase subunit G n=1 Tax=Alicycliphilus denitrificans (strain DSM 14773 / CIP 107495 / K601) TaxID=596154 RepID=F4G7N4_ALIDK|nr:carbon monoxide dehydrogenase subunit G [Alicycliphilus denitrificans]AEB86631.1 carbon monoxide dehydrogenase subunit G [Alicycliphilus denitrificans K601]
MDLRGQHSISASQNQVWLALNDPKILKECITGCESVDRTGDEEFAVRLVAAVGPVRAKFQGRIVLSDLVPPDSYKLTFEGQGGMAGFAKGSAAVDLQPDGQGTLLRYVATSQVGGKLAQVGSRLIEGAARKVADDFFSTFEGILKGSDSGTGEGRESALSTSASVIKSSSGTAWTPSRVSIGVAVLIALGAALYWYLR